MSKALKMPMVALTSFAMAGDKKKVLCLGFTGYLTKPFDTETSGQRKKKTSKRYYINEKGRNSLFYHLKSLESTFIISKIKRIGGKTRKWVPTKLVLSSLLLYPFQLIRSEEKKFRT